MKKIILFILGILFIPFFVYADLGGDNIGGGEVIVGWREEASQDVVRPRTIITDVGTIKNNNDGSINYYPASSDLVRANFLRLNNSSAFNEYVFPNSDGTSGQVLHTNGGRVLSWNTDDTGGAGGFSVYLEEGDIAKLDNSAANMTLDFDATDFDTGVVGAELNLTIASAITRDTEWDTEGEVQTVWGSVNILLETEIDASSELLALMDDETGTGNVVFSASPTLTGTAIFTNLNASGTATSDVVDCKYLENSSGGNVTVRDGLTVSGNNITANNIAGNKNIQFTIPNPSTLDASDLLPIWSNDSGKTFNITSLKGWSDGSYNVVLKKMDNDGQNSATLANFGISTAGTNIFYGSSNSASSDVVNNQVIYFDAGPEVRNEVKITIAGTLN